MYVYAISKAFICALFFCCSPTPGTSSGQPTASSQSETTSPASFEFVRIPGGCWEFGSSQEAPPTSYRACLPDYEIGRIEVTVAQFKEFVDAADYEYRERRTKCTYNQGVSLRAMNCVSWEQARDFCLSYGLRLPTTSEWERAARGPNMTVYPWGDRRPEIGSGVFSFYQRMELRHPESACSAKQDMTLERVCDMAGNVDEWVAGWWGVGGELGTGKVRWSNSYSESRPMHRRHGSSYASDQHAAAGHARRNGYSNLQELGSGFRCAR